MITLITGVPGAGKTLYCVSEILMPLDAANAKLPPEKRRKIFVHNVPDLQIEHEIAPDISNWPDWAPDGALIVIDEVQDVWRPGAASVKPGRDITELEVHRHRGLDFVVMTQHPNLMHSNVRRLVGKHIHIRRMPLGVFAYEFSEATNPDSVRNAISKVRWNHPKSAFGKYKSASIHQKVKFRVPGALKLLLFCVIAFIVLAWFAGHRIYQRVVPQTAESVRSAATSPVAPASLGQPALPAPNPEPQWQKPDWVHQIWLSGVSGVRDAAGHFQGVVIFKVMMSGQWVFVHAEDLENMGYRVTMPSDNVALVFDPLGSPLSVSWEPTQYNDKPADGHDYGADGGASYDAESAQQAPDSQPTAASGDGGPVSAPGSS